MQEDLREEQAMTPEPVLMCWSSGKDSALALEATVRDPALGVAALLVTVTDGYDRISMHGVRRSLLRAQAGALGMKLEEVVIPIKCSNAHYEQAMRQALEPYQAAGVNRCVFGDLFLDGIREYRERNLAQVGMSGLYPLWGRNTAELARQFIERGFRAVIVCVDSSQLDPSFCGREFDNRLLAELPAGVDPCGENGEFHTFVYDGPIFSHPVAVRRGEVVDREGFMFCDLLEG